MDNRDKLGPGSSASPDNRNGNGKGKGPHQAAKDAVQPGNEKLIEHIHQIISKTPDIRPEKVGPLQEAVEQGTYSIDVRKLANILITKLFLDT